MKVLAINGSPRGIKSSTAHILKPLLEGMESAGASTEIIHLSQFKIQPCVGCYLCWTKTPGKCFQKDDMGGLLEKFINSDIVILGTPLYHFTMSGILKNFIERTLPNSEPWLVESSSISGVTTHPERYKKPEAFALVSPCGFPEFNHFKPLVYWFDYYVLEQGKKNLGVVLRPAAEAMSKEELQPHFQNYYSVVHKAGEEMINPGFISEETKKKLTCDLFPGGADTVRKRANEHWEKILEKFKS